MDTPREGGRGGLRSPRARLLPLAQNFCFAWGIWALERAERRWWIPNPKADPLLKIFFIRGSSHAVKYTGLQWQVG